MKQLQIKKTILRNLGNEWYLIFLVRRKKLNVCYNYTGEMGISILTILEVYSKTNIC